MLKLLFEHEILAVSMHLRRVLRQDPVATLESGHIADINALVHHVEECMSRLREAFRCVLRLPAIKQVGFCSACSELLGNQLRGLTQLYPRINC
jgi:hypothetical protein